MGLYLLLPIALNWPSSSNAAISKWMLVSSLIIFILTSSIQWLVTNILRGDFRYGIAVANLLLVAYGTVQLQLPANSILVLVCTLIGLLSGQVLYYQIFRARSSPQHPINSNILDDEL